MDNLLKHLNFEYNLHSDMMSVFESHGVVDDADVFSLKIRDVLMELIKNGTLSDKTVIKSDIDCFDDIILFLNIEIIDSDNHIRTSRYDYNSEPRHPKIYLQLVGNLMYVRNSIAPTICHELAHAYENDKRRLNGKSGLSSDLNDFYKLSSIIIENNRMFSDDTFMLAKSIYWLTDSEQNANIGTLELELKQYKNNLSNPIEARDTIQSTELYSNFVKIKTFVDAISKWTDDKIDAVCADIKKHIYNFSIDRTILKRIINGLVESIERFSDKFNTTSSKLAYDISTENKYRFSDKRK